MGRGVRGRRGGHRRGHRGARRRGRRRRPGQSQRPHDGRRALPGAAGRRAAHPQRLHREHPGPDAQARQLRLPLRRPQRDPGARPRPHRPPGADRCQPAGLQRQSGHGGGLPRQAQGAAAARRPADRRRPQPHQDRRGGRPPCRAPAGHRRGAALRHGPGALRRGPRRPGRACTASERRGGSPRHGRGFHPRVRRRILRRARRGHPHPRAGTGRRGAGRGLRAAGQHRRGVRHPGQLAGRRPQRADREPRPAGRRDVPAVGHRQGAAAAASRPGLHHRALAQPGVGTPRGQGRTARRRPRRGDRHAGGGPAARPGRRRVQPGALRTRRPAHGPRAGRARLHGQRRSVSQRDVTARPRRPAAAPAGPQRALRLRVQHPRSPQHRPLQPARRPARRRYTGRTGDPGAADPRRPRPGRPRRRPGTRRRAGGDAQARLRDRGRGLAGPRQGPRGRGRTARRAHRLRAAARPDAAAGPLRRRLRRGAGRPHPGHAPRPPARHRPGAAGLPAARRAAHRLRHRRAGRGADRRGCTAAAGGRGRWRRAAVAGPDRAAPPAVQQQLDAQCAGPDRWQQPLHRPAAPRGRRPAGPGGRRAGPHQGRRRRDHRPGGDHRHAAPRSGVPAPRLGPRPHRHPADRRLARAGGQRQPAAGRQPPRPAVRHRGAQRLPDTGGAGRLTVPSAAGAAGARTSGRLSSVRGAQVTQGTRRTLAT
ncbi:hypothetical protein SCOCK_280009 [Actinacidiphila cocklensis]|uniref:Uncharacterized protein n=1 Tax=Actinacidiphila cocklensis TaxID=887465 RepID=A0A9W4DQV0_9ACTN|nr:hypothetical protein SCOCK_280009 [Actinacidiphila cocklensis]